MSVVKAPIIRSRTSQRISHEEVLSRAFSATGNALVTNSHRSIPHYGTHSVAVNTATSTTTFAVELHGAICLYIKPGATAPVTSVVTVEVKSQTDDWLIVYTNASLADLTEARVETTYRRARVTVVTATLNSLGTLQVGGE